MAEFNPSDLANDVNFWRIIEFNRDWTEQQKAIEVIYRQGWISLDLSQVLDRLEAVVNEINILEVRRECVLGSRLSCRVRSIYNLVITWKTMKYCPAEMMEKYYGIKPYE